MLYGEWHPRLLVNKLAGQKAPLLGLFSNYGLAFELNQGQAFYAYLAGVGVDFALPQPYSAGLNVYYRYDRFDRHEWQVSPFWNIPFALGPVPLLLSGFVDIAGSTDIDRNQALDVMAQPELLVDVLAPFGGKANRLYVGVEWYWHRYPSGFYGSPAPGHATSAPQAMVQWTVY
jgi:nucleoside-specific outer membrane channel protein Tsx